MTKTFFALFVALSFSGVASAAVGTFTGGDAGEGLDLDGTFAYAIDFSLDDHVENGGMANGGGVTVRDANFTAHDVAGVSVSTTAANGLRNEYGYADFLGTDTADDDALELIIGDGNWVEDPNNPGTFSGSNPATTGRGGIFAQGPLSISLDVQPNTTYVLQLLHSEGWDTSPAGGPRTYDVSLQGNLIADDFAPNTLTGPQPLDRSAAGGGTTSEDVVNEAAFISHTFTTGAAENSVTIDYVAVAGDPSISGLTLEVIPEPTSLALMAFAAAGTIAGTVRRRRR